MPLVERDELGAAGLDGHDPLAVVAFADYDAGGRVVRGKRRDALIRSCHRLCSLWPRRLAGPPAGPAAAPAIPPDRRPQNGMDLPDTP